MNQQRRVVTVLFADVVGSTGMGEKLDPEDLRGLLTRYYAIAREVIEEYGGTIEKFIGDAVMAMFGVPRAHDDDVRRALSAALDLRARVRADARLATRLPIRIGINTGEVASGIDETTGQELVTGDAINVAARIQQSATEWSIVVGDRTAAAARGEFSFGPLTSLEARGRSALVETRELLGPRTPGLDTTSFVGRETDLLQLDLVARRVFEEGQPWAVNVVAPPGAGKTRLLGEFLARLPSTPGSVVVAHAHCLPYGQRLSYWALRPLLADLVGIRQDADAEALLSGTQHWLEETGGTDDPRRTAEVLVATVGASAASPPDETELYAAWRTLVERAAHRAPLVLALEDLHWASDSLLDLLDQAIQPRRDVPALLFAVARPELLERRPTWGAGRRNQTTIDLTPLDDESMAAIVRELLPEASAATVEDIVDRAEGNPFFAIEMSRAILERRESTSVTGGLGNVLPDTVQATIQSRIDLLGPVDREVLQAGAVFGRSFPAGGVAAITATSLGDVRASIDRLVDRDLITIGEDTEAHPRHILIRDVAYGGLSRVARARLHAAVGQWLASVAATVEEQSERAELIAFHYREAATLLSAIDDPPAELPAVRRDAVSWLRRAAERAMGAAASSEAATHLEAAIELAGSLELPALYEQLGDTNLRGDLMADAYRRSFELARENGLDADAQLRSVSKLLMQYTRNQGAVAVRPTLDDIHRLRDDGRALIPHASDQEAIARFLIAEAFLPFWAPGAGDPTEAVDAARLGLSIAERLDDATLTSAALDALTALADTWAEANQHALRRLTFEERLPLAERLDAHAVGAWTAAMLGRLDEAASLAESGLAVVQPGQAPTFALHIAVWRAYALRLRGRWEELEHVGAQALELWAATGREAAGFAIRGFIDCLLVARARRDTEAAARYQSTVADILDRFPLDHPTRRLTVFLDPSGATAAGYLADHDVVLGELGVLGRGDYAERAIAICSDHGWRLPEKELTALRDEARRRGAVLLEAQLLRAIGLATGDAGALRSALTTYEACAAAPYVARTKIELGRLTADDALVQSGKAELETLGDLEQLGRADAR
jgi:class 3 adenylate cyclase